MFSLSFSQGFSLVFEWSLKRLSLSGLSQCALSVQKGVSSNTHLLRDFVATLSGHSLRVKVAFLSGLMNFPNFS